MIAQHQLLRVRRKIALPRQVRPTVHPDVVLFGGDDSTASIRAYWSHLPGAPVTRYNTIYAVNADLLARATPRLLDGIEQVCGKLDAARHTLKNQ